MKNTPDKTNSELRYIYLYRTNGFSDFEQHKDKQSALSDHEKQEYYCTDYFNHMVVLKGMIDRDTLSGIWGIWPGSDNGIRCAVVQSYTLYANEITSGDEITDSPFDCKDQKYLSVIQIHITPEIFSRLKIDHEGGTLHVLRPLLSELKDILSEFSKNNSKNKTVTKLYYMLSSGDFAVVTASNDPEASFRLSTRIRCRRAIIESDKKRTYALFKTYTLLAMRTDCIVKSRDKEDCSIALRGYYSNQYWADYGKYFERDDTGAWKLPLPVNPGHALYGRYDFTLRLPFEDYCRYIKRIYQSGDENSALRYEEQNESVRWLLELIEQKDISYMNTRLLLNGDTVSRIAEAIRQEIENNSQDDIRTSGIDLEEEYTKNFSDVVRERIKKVQELCDTLRDEVKAIPGYRKNLSHNLHLFEKLILQCESLNEVSDTRIYAVVIAKQIEAALCSMRKSLEIYNDSECDGEILDEIAGYVQESVRSIDIYADYIRNNNLQTLQMPNYNIETSSSVEKLLIGYSEFVNMIYNSVKDPGMLSIKKSVPIVVPALESEVVSVEVMFADGIGKNWKKESEILGKSNSGFASDNSKLVIVKSPTLTELSYMSSMIFSLLHEIAHQLRYESREERNRTITAICMGTLAHKMTEAVSELFCFETGERDLGMIIRGRVEQCIKEVFFSAFWNNHEMGEFSLIPYQKAPLVFFKKAVSQSCGEFLDQKILDIEKDILEYIRSTSRYFSYTDRAYNVAVLKLGQELKNFKAEIDRKAGTEDRTFVWNKTVKALEKAFSEYFTLLSDRMNSAASNEHVKDDPKEVGEVMLLKFSDLHKEFPSGVSARDHLEGRLYGTLCTMWERAYDFERERGKRDTLCRWTVFGRWMGIDVKSPSNKKQFITIFRKCILGRSKELCSEFENAVGRYREETADIFMCRTGRIDFTEYVSLMLINVKCDPEVEDKIIGRIVHVAVGMWCSVDPNTVAEEFWGLIRSAVDKIKEKTKAMFNSAAMDAGSNKEVVKELASFEKSSEELYQKLLDRWKKWTGVMCRDDDILDLWDIRKVFMDTFRWLRKNGSGDRVYGRLEKKLRHFIKYITILAQLLVGAQNIPAMVESQKEYFEDLKKGAEKYRPENYLREDSYLRKFSFETLLPIYSKDELKANEREDYNKFCIETLLDLFYLQKFRHAKESRRTEEKTEARNEEETVL